MSLNYEKTVWDTGHVITKEKLNKAEDMLFKTATTLRDLKTFTHALADRMNEIQTQVDILSDKVDILEKNIL